VTRECADEDRYPPHPQPLFPGRERGGGGRFKLTAFTNLLSYTEARDPGFRDEDRVMFRKVMFGLLLLSPLALYPFLSGLHPPICDIKGKGEKKGPYNPSKQEVWATSFLTISPLQPIPASLPWLRLHEVSEDRSAELLALAEKADPTALRDLAEKSPADFLEMCMRKYEKDVRGYKVMFEKQEKVKGSLKNPERVVCHFREKPFSVHMEWKAGAGLASKTLYVEGENDGNLVAKVFIIMLQPVNGTAAKSTSRFPITEFGIYKGAENTLSAIRLAERHKSLHIKFEGIVPVAQLGDRRCYKFVRSPYDPNDYQTDLDREEKLMELTIYVDEVYLMQTGSILKDGEGKLIAEYYFRDLELNPEFGEDQFTRKSLK